MSKIDDMVAAGRTVLGAPYHFWGGGALEACSPEYVDCPGADANYLFSNGVNCSGFINWIRTQVGLPTVGGTAAYGDWIAPLTSDPSPDWTYDPNATYPVGTLLVEPYVEGVSEGHMVMVSTENQYILQATIPRGVNEDYTHAEMNQYTPFSWAGYMPDCLPGGDSPTPVGKGTPFDVDLLMLCYSNSLDRQTAEADLPYLLEGFKEFEINSKQRIAAYLAVASGESGELQFFAEEDPPAEYGIYYGRGMLGLTFAAGYQAFSSYLGDPSIMSNPYQLEQPPLAIRSGCWFWRYGSVDGNLNESADKGDFASCMAGVYGAPDPPNADTRVAYYNWILSQLPDNVTVDGGTGEGHMSYSKYTFVTAGPEDQNSLDFANACATALESLGVDSMVLHGADNVAAASQAINDANDVTKLNCIVVGKAAHALLDTGAQSRDGWAADSPIWSMWSDDGTPVGTLKKVRDWALWWIATYGQSPAMDLGKLKAVFDAVLLGINATEYATLLSEAENQPGPPPPPPDAITLDQLMAVKKTDLKDDDMVVVLKRKVLQ